jgi:type II secretory pathway pseudopilin PulG
MTSLSRRRCCGFTLLEGAVAAALFALLTAVLVSRLLFYNGEAERVAAEQLIGTLRTALQVRSAHALATRGEAGLAPLVDENPMAWLSGKPDNYLGEFYSPDPRKIPTGNWFFDRSDRSLAYLPNDHESFSIETSKFLKFKVKLILLPNPDASSGRSKVSKGVTLDQVNDRIAVNTN